MHQSGANARSETLIVFFVTQHSENSSQIHISFHLRSTSSVQIHAAWAEVGCLPATLTCVEAQALQVRTWNSSAWYME